MSETPRNSAPIPVMPEINKSKGPRLVDVLFLVEHVARELDIACAVKAIAESKVGLTVAVKQVYHDVPNLLVNYLPRIVVTPSFYSAEDLANKEYVTRWPEAIFFNLAWEEIFYKGHVQMKAPADVFTKTSVVHHAWGNFYRDYLISHGVNPDHIFVNGNPVYRLYHEPYRNFYVGRDLLARKYGLNPNKRWVFVPENYRWAFISDGTIDWRVKQGANRAELTQMRAYAQVSLKELLLWCNRMAGEDGYEIIVRPKPATERKEMEQFFEEHLGVPRASALHFEKGESVREWILASDIVISSFSTTLIEAAVAGKPAAMVEPLPLTDSFQADWYSLVSRLTAEADFVEACRGHRLCDSSALGAWARQEMLAVPDPIDQLADFLHILVLQLKQSNPRPAIPAGPPQLFHESRQYFNERTHENDIFDDRDVRERCDRWTQILGLTRPLQREEESFEAQPTVSPDNEICASLVICTYNRAALLRNCLDSIAAQTHRGKDIEVIVVDNNSTDETAQVVANYGDKFPYPLRSAKETKQGLSHSRNKGFEVARGRYIVYLDDDATIPANYVTEMQRIITGYQPDIVGGPVYPYYTSTKPSWFRDEFEIRKYAEKSGFSPCSHISGGNFTIRRALLRQLGLFDPKYGMTGETIGMLEERKLLEQYRMTTLPQQRKIFYSLECYINHHTPASKMNMRYIFERAAAAGTAGFELFYEVGKDRDCNKALSMLTDAAVFVLQQIEKRAASRVLGSADALSDLVSALINAMCGLARLRAALEKPGDHLSIFDRQRLLFTAVKAAETILSLRLVEAVFSAGDFAELSKGLNYFEQAVDALKAMQQAEIAKVMPSCPDFSEEVYLEQNPDIEAAVCAGFYISGLEHFIERGHQENRLYRTADKGKETTATKLRDVDILWLVEHVSRELDVGCAVRALLEEKLGLRVEVKSMTYDINDLLRRCNPRVVCFPYFYALQEKAIEEYVTRWPSSIFVNLAWEEIFFKGHLKIKAPSDETARNKVIHHAWGEFYKSYLTSHGVSSDLVFVNGNPVYQLYQPGYREYFTSREELATQHSLDPKKKWVFVPENYRWAFISDDVIEYRTKHGANRNEMLEMRNFAVLSLGILLQWCEEVAKEGNIELIVRPKPATALNEMERFYSKAFLTEVPPTFRIIKEGSVREWILASNVISSSFSTTLIEAAMAEKPAFMVEPLPLTEAFQASWYELLPRIRGIDEFRQACAGGSVDNGRRLRDWAKTEMLATGDPIIRLAGFLANLVNEQRAVVPSVRETVCDEPLRRMPYRYYNPLAYEKDIFSEGEVKTRTERWKIVLGLQAATGSAVANDIHHQQDLVIARKDVTSAVGRSSEERQTTERSEISLIGP